MAKPTKNTKQANKGGKPTDTPKEGQEIQITVVPDYSHPFPAFYSNYASVSHSTSEVFVDFCLLGMPFNVDLEQKSITAPVTTRIILPPKIIAGLIQALQAQMSKQQNTEKQGGIILPLIQQGGKS